MEKDSPLIERVISFIASRISPKAPALPEESGVTLVKDVDLKSRLGTESSPSLIRNLDLGLESPSHRRVITLPSSSAGKKRSISVTGSPSPQDVSYDVSSIGYSPQAPVVQVLTRTDAPPSSVTNEVIKKLASPATRTRCKLKNSALSSTAAAAIPNTKKSAEAASMLGAAKPISKKTASASLPAAFESAGKVLVKNEMDVKVEFQIELIKAKWIGRHNEIQRLHDFLVMSCFSNEPKPSCLLVVGGPCTGKTTIVMDLIQQMDLQYVYLTAAQYITGSSSSRVGGTSSVCSKLFPLLARQLPDMDTNTAKKCTSTESFAIEIQSRLPTKSLKPFVFVLDEVDDPDILDSMSEEAWKAFKELKDRTGSNIKLILIGRAEDDRVRSAETVTFSQYSEKVCKRIISKQLCPSSVQENEFETFLQFVFSKFWTTVTIVLDDLTYICEILWPAFHELRQRQAPALSSSVTVAGTATSVQQPIQQLSSIFKQLQPAVKHLSKRAYFRDCESVSSLMKRLNKYTNAADDISKRLQSLIDSDMVHASELPYHGKVLLLALYMASFNPNDHDAILFGSKKRRKVKRQKRILPAATSTTTDTGTGGTNSAANNNDSLKQLDVKFVGPKAFSLERGRWIFRAILTDLRGAKEAEDASLNILRYVQLLCSLKLVAKCSDELELTDIKLKCLASDEFCEAVATNLNLDFTKYLARHAVE